MNGSVVIIDPQSRYCGDRGVVIDRTASRVKILVEWTDFCGQSMPAVDTGPVWVDKNLVVESEG